MAKRNSIMIRALMHNSIGTININSIISLTIIYNSSRKLSNKLKCSSIQWRYLIHSICTHTGITVEMIKANEEKEKKRILKKDDTDTNQLKVIFFFEVIKRHNLHHRNNGIENIFVVCSFIVSFSLYGYMYTFSLRATFFFLYWVFLQN